MSDATLPARPRRRWQRAVAILLLAALGLALLTVSGAPSVETKGPPDAQSVQAATDVVRQIRDRNGVARVRLTNRELHGVATLAGDATGFARVDARVDDGRFHGAASMPLPVWGWINTAVEISGDHEGFPELQLKVGRFPVPSWAARWMAEYGRFALRLRGADLPPLDQLVRNVTVGKEELVAEIDLPHQSGIVRGLASLQGVEVDDDAVADIYCRLVALDREDPATALEIQVQRAFAGAPAPTPVDYNRSALIALAWFAVDERVGYMAPDAIERVRACGGPSRPIRLAGREDLAKHWTLSAALSAVFGSGAARAMGEWKELDDSLPEGTGFSFVDLAADRSGLNVARRATDPATAAAERGRLTRMTEAQILPIALIAAEEGLSEQQFLERYGTVQASRYQTTVAEIDRLLARAATPKPIG